MDVLRCCLCKRTINKTWLCGETLKQWLIVPSQSAWNSNIFFFLFLEQTWTLVPGTSRLRSVLCGQTSNASTAAAMTRTTATRTFCLWTTACRASWDSGWTCLRTSKWTMTCGWSGRSSPNLFHGRSCSSEDQWAQSSSHMHYDEPLMSLSLVDHRSMHRTRSVHTKGERRICGSGKWDAGVDFKSWHQPNALHVELRHFPNEWHPDFKLERPTARLLIQVSALCASYLQQRDWP